jgi:hypothetical protein
MSFIKRASSATASSCSKKPDVRWHSMLLATISATFELGL